MIFQIANRLVNFIKGIKDINRLKNGLSKINNKNLVSLSKSQKSDNEEIFMNYK